MGIGKFISVIPLESDYGIIYNAVTDKFIIAHKNLCNEKSVLTQINENSEFAKQLRDAEIVIESDVDELKRLRDRIDEIDNDQSHFILHVNPTLNCNFRCWYCYEEHKGTSKMSKEVVESVKLFILKTIKTNPALKTFQLSFFGGEPLMYFNDCAKPIIEHLYSVCEEYDIQCGLHFTTNGYLLNEGIATFLNKYHPSLQITLDGHRLEHDNVRTPKDGSGSYDRILANIQKMAEAGCQIYVRINYTKSNLESVSDIRKDLGSFSESAKKHLVVDLQRVWQDKCSHTELDVSEKILDLRNEFQKSGLQTTTFHTRLNPNTSCYGDKRNNLLINFDGSLFFCTARDFNEKNSCGKLNSDGSINWKYESILDERMKLKLSKSVCQSCKIAPLCAGGCRQQNWEHREDDICPIGLSEEDKKDLIINRIESLIDSQ